LRVGGTGLHKVVFVRAVESNLVLWVLW
jgi:hypothetical protein